MENSKYSRYPGIRSFEPHERKQFFGRKRETRELHDLIKAERFMVLFAKSGIGKTSLLNAGIMPLLKQDIYHPISVRFQGKGEGDKTGLTPAESLRKSIESLAEHFWIKEQGQKRLKDHVKGRKPLLWEHLKAYPFEQEVAIMPVLILDQFEEFFLHSEEDQKELVDCLADIVYDRVPKLLAKNTVDAGAKEEQNFFDENFSSNTHKDDWNTPLNWKVIIAIRSDRLSLLDRLSDSIPAILNKRYQLYAFKREQATDAIVSPAQLEGDQFNVPQFDYDPDALDLIIHKLSNKNGEIEAFQLQIICQHIEQKLKDQKLNRVAPDLLGGEEGIQEILEGYYRRKIATLGNAEEQLAARILIEEGLIVSGARVGLAENSILTQYNIPKPLLTKILRTRILRRENTHLGLAYEVAHDTLVEPILASYEERRKEQEEKAQQQKLVAERKQRALEKEQQEEELAEQRKQLAQEKYLRGRANRRSFIASIFAILAVIASVWAYLETQKVHKAEVLLENQLEESNQLLRAFYEEQFERYYNQLPIYVSAGQCSTVISLADKSTSIAQSLIDDYKLQAEQRAYYQGKLNEIAQTKENCQ
ncbi:MAG: hypothetical protein GY810_06485 [Aureispira sp.]|nr:hypothetical protein [Aureispira sp.]